MSVSPAQNPFPEGPYVTVAAICERVLHERDGVLSLIRVVDRFFQREVDPTNPDQMPPLQINAWAVINLKAGGARGRHSVTVRPETPSGFRLPDSNFPVLFEGEDRGVNLLVQLTFQADQEGLYWFDVLLDNQPLTRMPLRVVFEPITVGRPGGQAE